MVKAGVGVISWDVVLLGVSLPDSLLDASGSRPKKNWLKQITETKDWISNFEDIIISKNRQSTIPGKQGIGQTHSSLPLPLLFPLPIPSPLGPPFPWPLPLLPSPLPCRFPSRNSVELIFEKFYDVENDYLLNVSL